jgi:hypothetical protein
MNSQSNGNNSNGSNGNRPVHSVRHGRIKASVWVNSTKNGPMHNVTFARSYQDDEGNWHDSQSFGFEDLMTVAKCAFDVHSWVSADRAQNAKDSAEREDERQSPKKAAAR